MKLFWTRKKSFCGLRHFVLIKELEIKNIYFVEMVSVLDSNVSLRIRKVELDNTDEWMIGWQELCKSDSITSDYESLNKGLNDEIFNKIYVDESSPFNVS